MVLRFNCFWSKVIMDKTEGLLDTESRNADYYESQYICLFWRIFFAIQVSSWSTGLVCRQSTIRESRDLNNKGKPPRWPWQSWDRYQRDYIAAFHYWSTTWIQRGPSQLFDIVNSRKHFPTVVISFLLLMALRVQIFPSSKHYWQGQMEAGWFGEIQTDFWMLLGRCGKREWGRLAI